MSSYFDQVWKIIDPTGQKRAGAGVGPGIGPNGPQYNPGTSRQFTPGPMPDVPFMPQAQVGPQSIALGGAPQGQPNLGLTNGAVGGLMGRAGMGVPTNGANGGLAGNAGVPPRNPNNLPTYAPIPGQDANYNQQPGTHAGAAAPKPGGFNASNIMALLASLQKNRQPQQAPMEYKPMQFGRWGQ